MPMPCFRKLMMEAVLTDTHFPERMDASLTSIQISRRLSRIGMILPALFGRLDSCTLCPRYCRARRQWGETGECGMTDALQVASVARHFGEEPPISGTDGIINVFFSGCNLHCLHCQNWPLSQLRIGAEMSPERLAEKILRKWRRGAHMLGWVTPTPQIPAALEAYRRCLQEGFDLPLVHNGGGYEDINIIRQLAGVVDIWLPDAKTVDPQRAADIQGVLDYPVRNWEAITEMVAQVRRGDARAVIVRHLLLPGGLADSQKLLKNLWDQFGNDIYLSLMVQYFPFYKAIGHQVLGRKLRQDEYEGIVAFVRKLGFKRGWVQEYDTETGILHHCLS